MPGFAQASGLDAIIVSACLAGKREFSDAVVDALNKFFLLLAQRYGRDFTPDDHQEVISQTWDALARRTYDPGFASPWPYLENAVKTAVREIRARNTPAGERTRLAPRKDGETTSRARNNTLSLDAPSEEATGLPLVDAIPDYRPCRLKKTEDEMVAEVLLDEARRTAPAGVADVLELVYYDGIPFTRAAQMIGEQHTTIRRRTDRWAAKFNYYDYVVGE